MEKLLTSSEAAQRLGITVKTVWAYCKRGAFRNAKQVGALRQWAIPESEVDRLAAGIPPDQLARRYRPRKRLQPGEYEAAGLVVVAYWKHRPPRLRCPVCGQEWRSWEWRCPTGCNPDAMPYRGQAANPQLKQARRALGLTQKDLAQAAGVTIGAVMQWETRGSQPRKPETRQRVADLLGFDPWEVKP
jgi:DNA-binding XRE family transcriptional regulator/predicted DNA-binding transcriptional regulator AlpA